MVSSPFPNKSTRYAASIGKNYPAMSYLSIQISEHYFISSLNGKKYLHKSNTVDLPWYL